MKKSIVRKVSVFGAIAIVLLMVSSATGTNVQPVEQIQKVVSEPQNQDINLLLSKYGLNTESTIGEFEKILRNLVLRTPLRAVKLLRNLHTLSDILEQIGVTDDMTIAEALPVIKNDPKPLQDVGINLFCSVDIEGYGTTRPIARDTITILGGWSIYYADYPGTHAEIDGSSGRQYCEYECGGRVIGFFGHISCLKFQPAPCATVDGTALYSISDVPFV